MTAPGKTLDQADIQVKDGKIVAVGVGLKGDEQSVRLDMKGKVIHAAFLDPYTDGDKVGLEKTQVETGTPISGTHPRVHDDLRVADYLQVTDDTFKDFRELGYAVVAVVPQDGIFRGQSTVYRTGDGEGARTVIRPGGFSVVNLEELGWDKLKGENYPLALIGSVALVRQTFLDLDWYRKARSVKGYVDEKPDFSANLESLQAVRDGRRLLVGESNNFLDDLRLLHLFKEVGLKERAVMLCGEEWRELSWLQAALTAHDHLLLPLNFPDDPEADEGLGQSRHQWAEFLRKWYNAPANPRWLAEKGVDFSFSTHGLKDLEDQPKRLREAVLAGLPASTALAALTTEPAAFLGLSDRYGTLEPGKSASFVVRDGGPFDKESAVVEVWVDGQRHLDLERLGKGEAVKKKEVEARAFVQAHRYAQPPSLLPQMKRAHDVLFRNATVWTQGPSGVLKQCDVLVKNGKIAAVGQGLQAGGAQVVDCAGLHLTPGIVDCHSHTALAGEVNEPGANVTSMVRMKDILNPFDYNIYLQLAGGVTTVNILHGSANAIGGQSVTCKWRYGSPPEGLIFAGAPGGIKFALGENPKQSNWGDAHQSRYPQSRMGVMELIRGSFVTALNYRKLMKEGKHPKPDLKLDALLEVLDGKRLVHCHCYRQDEILALIHTAEEVGFRVNVFHHVLEGYKVADQIAKYGAGCSTFADWWAYKLEVQDAIPQNAALLHEAGVLVSVNSDSDDLARRLNTEAAKSIRYGGMSEVDALNMVTRNPAKQLGILDKTGTLEVGKDADLVLWNDDPLKQNALVLQTWIDGNLYFEQGEQPEQKVDAELKTYLKALLGEEDEK